MEIDVQTLNNAITKVFIGSEKDDSGTLSGSIELDIENQSKFVETINSLFESGQINILIDMTNISYLDSSGLWALFEGHKKANQKNGHMVLVNPAKDVKRVLDITKMSSKMDIFNNDEEALSFLNQ